jgi:hypothetical protein
LSVALADTIRPISTERNKMILQKCIEVEITPAHAGTAMANSPSEDQAEFLCAFAKATSEYLWEFQCISIAEHFKTLPDKGAVVACLESLLSFLKAPENEDTNQLSDEVSSSCTGVL